MAIDKATTTSDVAAGDPQPTTSGKPVSLKSPTGSKVTASPQAAEKLKAQGWK